MSEQAPTPEPYAFEKIKTVSGEYHELHRDNTTIFRHLGASALYDHIFVRPKEGNPVYLWRFSPSTGQEVGLYHHILPQALDNDCQDFHNIRKVSEDDVNMYISHATGDLKDIPPEFDKGDEE